MTDFKHAMNSFKKYLENFDSKYGKFQKISSMTL